MHALGNGFWLGSLLGHGFVRFFLLGHELVRFSLRAWCGAGPSLSRPGLGRDHLSSRQDYFGVGWDNLNMDVLSLDPGYLSLCTQSAGRV